MSYQNNVKNLIRDAENRIFVDKKDDVLNELVKRHVQLKALLTFYRQTPKELTIPSNESITLLSLAAGADATVDADIVTSLDPESLVYKLAVTDLSVATAMDGLEKKLLSISGRGRYCIC